MTKSREKSIPQPTVIKRSSLKTIILVLKRWLPVKKKKKTDSLLKKVAVSFFITYQSYLELLEKSSQKALPS